MVDFFNIIQVSRFFRKQVLFCSVCFVCNVYIQGHRRILEITADILNNFSNCKHLCYCLVMVFAFTFPFTWFSLLVFLHVFAAVFFGYFIHSKVLSLSVFKAFFRILVFRFI
jgi:hypothetical protein